MRLLWNFLYLFVLSIVSKSAQSQDCQCEKNLMAVIRGIEDNYAGYHDNIKNDNKRLYSELKQKILLQSKNIDLNYLCIRLLSKYISFFNDGHINLRRDIQSNAAKLFWGKVFSAIHKTKNSVDTIKLKQTYLKKKNSPEGLWINDINNLSVAIIRGEKNIYRGVVIKSDSVIWYPNQIKFELNVKTRNAIFYNPLHIPKKTIFTLNEKDIYFGKYGRFTKYFPVTESKNQVLGFKIMNYFDSIVYISLPSFNLRYVKTIDSLVSNNKLLLDSAKYLIVDLRDNGGGSILTYQPLYPYFAPAVYVDYGAMLRTSVANANYYEFASKDTLLSVDARVWFMDMAKKIRDSINTKYITLNDKSTASVMIRSGIAKKIFFLANTRTASAAEFLLEICLQDERSVLVGLSTAGGYDYSNVNNEYELPCSFIKLAYPTIRSNINDIPGHISNQGFKPVIVLTIPNEEWLSFVINTITCPTCIIKKQ